MNCRHRHIRAFDTLSGWCCDCDERVSWREVQASLARSRWWVGRLLICLVCVVLGGWIQACEHGRELGECRAELRR